MVLTPSRCCGTSPRTSCLAPLVWWCLPLHSSCLGGGCSRTRALNLSPRRQSWIGRRKCVSQRSVRPERVHLVSMFRQQFAVAIQRILVLGGLDAAKCGTSRLKSGSVRIRVVSPLRALSRACGPFLAILCLSATTGLWIATRRVRDVSGVHVFPFADKNTQQVLELRHDSFWL